MPSSKPITKEQAPLRVMEFQPRPIEKVISQSAESFLRQRDVKKQRFTLSDLVASQTGIAERERFEREAKAEGLALEKVKEIQEPAYKIAYDLGLEEGRKSAFEEASQEILDRLSRIDELILSMGRIKNDLLTQNEGSLVKMVCHLAVQVARFEISHHDDRIMGVLRQAVEHTQSQETILVKVSKSDFEFLNTIKDFTKRELEFLKKVKLDPQNDIADGGCVVETNYGTVDASLEERIRNLWQALDPKIPKITEKIVG